MATPAAPPAAMHDHKFHSLRVARVVEETADARSFALDVPPELHTAFAYAAGQFCTFRVWVDGRPHFRCYSMSSSPEVDDELQVTVKRVPKGLVSNWMIDELAPGATVDTSCPAGVFRLAGDGDVVAFCGGSGITPVFSLVKTALATTSRRVRLLYANRDRESIIFEAALNELRERYAGRLDVVHHLDCEQGFVTPGTVRDFLELGREADYFLCGPGPFMDVVEGALVEHGVDSARIHLERFTPAEPTEAPPASAGAPTSTQVTIELDGRTGTTEHRAGTTILQTARQLGMSPPFSCESGNCATCMAKVVDGAVTMHANNALTDDEVAEGWVLTCQSVPTTPTVHVVYGLDPTS